MYPMQRPQNAISFTINESLMRPFSAVRWGSYRDPHWSICLGQFSLQAGPVGLLAATAAVTCAVESSNEGSMVTASLRGDWFPSHQGPLTHCPRK